MANKPQHGWKESFALQIPAIDAQHRSLFDLVYQLECALEAGKEEEIIGQTLEKLKECCQQHFITEERLMREYEYPGLHAHVMQHDDFTRAAMVIEFELQDEAEIARQLVVFLKQWLIVHIVDDDQKIVPFVMHPIFERGAETSGMPILVEVMLTAKCADTAVCTRTADHLTTQGLPFVGLAHTLDETRSTIETMKSLGHLPAIFVVNTFGARGVLAELDSLMGDLPVLYLRRALYAGRSGLLDQANLLPPGVALTGTAALTKMKPRLTSMWFYGTQNSGMIAQRAAEGVSAYLKTGDFRQIERVRPTN